MRKRSLMWFVTALCAACLTVAMHWQDECAVPERNSLERPESSVMSPLRQQPHEATLTDATQLYRICPSRPQRILTTHGSRSERTVTPFGSFVRHHIVKPLRSYFDSRCRLESAPFCLSASCLYYVIALRHIIR